MSHRENKSIIWLFFAHLVIVAGANFTVSVQAENIAILTDGPSEHTALISRLLKAELKEIASNDELMLFPECLQKEGQWTEASINNELSKLLNNKQYE